MQFGRIRSRPIPSSAAAATLREKQQGHGQITRRQSVVDKSACRASSANEASPWIFARDDVRRQESGVAVVRSASVEGPAPVIALVSFENMRRRRSSVRRENHAWRDCPSRWVVKRAFAGRSCRHSPLEPHRAVLGRTIDDVRPPGETTPYCELRHSGHLVSTGWKRVAVANAAKLGNFVIHQWLPCCCCYGAGDDNSALTTWAVRDTLRPQRDIQGLEIGLLRRGRALPRVHIRGPERSTSRCTKAPCGATSYARQDARRVGARCGSTSGISSAMTPRWHP